MRTIKFRGKDSLSSTLVYGDLVQHVLADGTKKTSIVQVYGTYDVIPETVGQFTGLRDKNGKEIYEGDILYVTVFDFFGGETQYKVQVLWEDAGFVGEYSEIGEEKYWSLQWLCGQDDEIEVIGNIYDNLELLK